MLGLEIDLRNKRDDLYPQFGGGSKARKIVDIVNHATRMGFDALVTNGRPQSNHARATALIAAELGLRCHIIIVAEDDTDTAIEGNLFLMKLSGASIEFCKKHEIASHMDKSIDQLASQGFKPYYIWGGGHCIQGTHAFVEAAKEAQAQCGDWLPDYIVLASGTGTTQAGLAIGYAGFDTDTIGISVARDQSRGSGIIKDSINAYCKEYELDSNLVKVNFRDAWTLGGYEKSTQTLIDLIIKAAKSGYLFDPTYTGKALLGMVSMIQNGEISKGSKVLFWHTGGLHNLISSKLFISMI